MGIEAQTDPSLPRIGLHRIASESKEGIVYVASLVLLDIGLVVRRYSLFVEDLGKFHLLQQLVSSVRLVTY